MDSWEYYKEGELKRIGIDRDGDGVRAADGDCNDSDPSTFGDAADAWGNSDQNARAHRARAEVLFLRGQDQAALRQMRFALDEADGQFALRSKLSARMSEMERLSSEEF